MLTKGTIQSEIKEAFQAVMDQQEGREEALDTLSGKIADAVINAIKSVQITYSAGLTTPVGGGAVTGTFQYSIS